MVRPIFKVCNYLVSQLPAADVVEVVRCKDCKHYEFFKDSIGRDEGKRLCNNMFWNNEFFPETEADDFCSYGERRSDNAVD